MIKALYKLFDDLMYWLKKYVYIIPIIHIALTLLVTFIDFDFWGYVRLGNSSGYSILTGLVYMVLFVYKTNYCLFTKVSVIGLFFIAILNCFGSLFLTTPEAFLEYEKLHSRAIVAIVLALTLISTFIPRKK